VSPENQVEVEVHSLPPGVSEEEAQAAQGEPESSTLVPLEVRTHPTPAQGYAALAEWGRRQAERGDRLQAELDDTVSALQATRSELETALRDLAAERAAHDEDLVTMQESHDTNLRSLRQELVDRGEILDEAERLIDDLRHQLVDKQTAISLLEEKLRATLAERDCLAAEVDLPTLTRTRARLHRRTLANRELAKELARIRSAASTYQRTAEDAVRDAFVYRATMAAVVARQPDQTLVVPVADLSLPKDRELRRDIVRDATAGDTIRFRLAVLREVGPETPTAPPGEAN